MFINYFCLAFDWFLTIRRVRVAMMQSCNVDRVAATVLGITVWASPPPSKFITIITISNCCEDVECVKKETELHFP